jgi:membrane protein
VEAEAEEDAVVAPKQALAMAKDTFNEFMKDEATWKAAALSYFIVFALAPLLVLLLQVASFIWDPAEVRGALTGQFQALMGREVAGQVETMMTSAEQKTESGSGFRLILSIAGLLFGATGAFVALQTALNRAWEVEPDPKSGGIKNFLTKRLFSLGMVLAIAFLLMVSLAVTAALTAAGDLLFGAFGEVFAQVLNFALTFLVIAALFAAMFKVLPDAKVDWRDVRVGAVVTALLFVIGKTLIGLYIGQSDPGSAFGAAGSLAVLLVWIYYAAVILLLGAEFTQVWMKHHGREIEPEKGAVRIVEKKARVRGSSIVDADAEDAAADDADTDDTDAADSGNGSRSGRRPNAVPAFAATQPKRAVAAAGSIEDRERKIERSDEVVRARQDMADTRARMSNTVRAIESRAAYVKHDAAEKLDASKLVQEHPWPALAAAIVAGVALSATRADEKAAEATIDVAKRGASVAADGIQHVGEAVANRLHADELAQELKCAASEIGGRSS